MATKNKTVRPNILVIEGLWSDLDDIITAAGGTFHEEDPWHPESAIDELLSGRYNGLLLTGGSDINPALYGEEPHKEVYGIDDMRDWVELRALEIAREQGIPVLGICRGSQIMAASRGGSLHQHIESHRGTQHTVYAVDGAKNFRRACNSREMQCISLHHQMVKEPGDGMRIAAMAADGTVEAIESEDGKWLGCQFHPEMNALENGNSFAIFQWLVGKAAEHAGGRAPHTRFRDARRNALRAAREAVAARSEGPPVRMYYPTPTQREEAERAYWDDADGFPQGYPTRGQAVPARHAPPRHSRKAGDRSIPTMKEMVSIIEGSARTRHELQVCAGCGLLFDNEDDRIDHEIYVCQIGKCSGFVESTCVEEPPAGHPAWEIRGDLH